MVSIRDVQRDGVVNLRQVPINRPVARKVDDGEEGEVEDGEDDEYALSRADLPPPVLASRARPSSDAHVSAEQWPEEEPVLDFNSLWADLDEQSFFQKMLPWIQLGGIGIIMVKVLFFK